MATPLRFQTYLPMKKLSLSIAVFLSTFFSPHLFSANLLVDYDEQKEGSYSTQSNNQVEQPKQVCDYTILNNKNVNHTLEDIEDLEEDLRDDVSAVNQRLVTSNNQSTPLLLGAVLQHKQTKKHYQYLIADTGLLSNSTQPNAVKRAHRKGFHLIKATRGHVSLQLLEWLQISKHYIVIALKTNRPVCRNCYLIANSLWEKELKTNEKGCIEAQFSVLDKMPNLAQQYINTHLNLSLVQSLVVPMMGYVSKEEMQKAIQQKDKEMASTEDRICLGAVCLWGGTREAASFHHMIVSLVQLIGYYGEVSLIRKSKLGMCKPLQQVDGQYGKGCERIC